jgi:hypothetical protein
MRANSRNRLRWGVATAFAALALGALPLSFDDDAITGKAALADGGGNGKLLAAYPKPLSVKATSEQHDLSGDSDKQLATGSDQAFDEGYRIGDDSDIASVEGSANDTEDASIGLLDETF